MRIMPSSYQRILPAQRAIELPRPNTGARQIFDVAGGLCFALLVGFLCIRLGNAIFAGSGWMAAITWETVWLVAAMTASPLLPSGVRHTISWSSTFRGLLLDWPELLFTLWVIISYSALIGGFVLHWGPLLLALSVGFAEEMFFRILILGWLITRISTPKALALSSLVFGVAHLQSVSIDALIGIIPQTAGGFVLGAIYLRTRNPLGPIIAHAIWDYPYFMVIGYLVPTASAATNAPLILQIVPWLLLTIYGLWLVRDGIDTAGRRPPLASLYGSYSRPAAANSNR